MRTVRDMRPEEIGAVVDYFLDAETPYAIGMGVDKAKLPPRQTWLDALVRQVENGERYYVAWLLDDTVVGHSNLSDVDDDGRTAHMHLHIWRPRHRRDGNGLAFLRETLPRYFRRFPLETLVCEPYALNPAPHRALERAGFERVRTYDTVPGPIGFYQPVTRYELSRSRVVG